MTENDRHALAARIRGLIAGQDRGDLGATAARLGVEELSLRMSVDELSPHPTLEVILAVIDHYGVDPNWLLTGDYDRLTHVRALEEKLERAEKQRLRDLVLALGGSVVAGGSVPTFRSDRLQS